MSRIFFLLPILILFSIKTNAQNLNNPDYGLNLSQPSNEMYLFTTLDEGANAFRLNPAVLGLHHKFNTSLGIFFERRSHKNKLNEIDLNLNFGGFGLGYRRALSYTVNGFEHQYEIYSIGFGFGNKIFTGGIDIEDVFRVYTGSSNNDFAVNFFNLGLGFLFRSNKYISSSLVIKTNEAMSMWSAPNSRFSAGVAIRPFGNNRISLLFDFGISPYKNEKSFDHRLIKTGVEVKVIDGFYLNANYLKINDYIVNELVNFGIRIEGPHSSIRYNNPLLKVKSDPYQTYNQPFHYSGSSIIFSYSAEHKETFIPDRPRILEITIKGSLQDYSTEDVLFGILGNAKRSIHQLISDIDDAAKDNSVKALLVKIYPLSTGRFDVNAQMEEIGSAMERFKHSGKKITVYFPEDVKTGEYYLGAFADNIVMPPEAIFFYGLSIDVMNFKQFLDKYGIELQTFHAGKYKLTFQGLLDSTTEEGNEVINRVLDIIYDKMLKQVEQQRHLTVDEYLRKKLSQPITAVEAKRLGLVDDIGWYNEAKDIAENHRDIKIVNNLNRNVWDNAWSEPDKIAVIGVYGSITTGESEPPSPIQIPIPYLNKSRSTGSETVLRQLEEAFANPRVKAIILRVDSGGGSALASAEINSAIIRLKEKYKKLFIVSMGGAAASGGYEVSANADKIFADDLTITGSIGVFTARPNLDSLMKSQKIKVETFKRGENSDIGSVYHHLDEQEIEIIQSLIDYYYDRFIETVSKGRKISKEEANEVAQGRVWLGSDAFNKKLVDVIGGLHQAVLYAKKQVHLDNRFEIEYYEVPGGERTHDLITKSILQYLENFLQLDVE